MSEREPSELPHPKERKATAAPPVLPAVIDPPRSTSEPVPLANVIVPMDAPAETCHDPLIHLVRCTSQLGDSPMIRNWKTLTMVALLSQAAVTFVPQPAVAQETDRKTPPNELKALDDLQKSVNALIERIDKLEKKKSLSADDLADVVRTEIRAELKKAHEAIYKNFDGIAAELTAIRQIQLAHKREIDKLSDDLNGLRKKLADGAGTPAVDKAFMEEFRSSLKTLNDTIARLGPTKERISGAAPINGSAKGRLVIVNLYNEDLLFLVNGAPHRVPAGMSAVLEVPAGTLNYRVHSNRWGPLSHQTTNLAAGDTYTLTAAFQR
jgi:ElaB/YqjD/DUF883 family membrane-anchored ribosome-binding protein